MTRMPSTVTLAGRLMLRPGGAVPLHCHRPVVTAEGMRRLTEGRRANMVPDLLGSLFALCGTAHRLTAQRAVGAALGLPDETPAEAQRAAQLLRLSTVRDLLQRLAFDLPTRVPVEGLAVGTWLQGAPWAAALDGVAGQDPVEQFRNSIERLSRWLEQRLLGCPVEDWLRGWQEAPHWMARWAARHGHPVARWFDAVHARAAALALPCRPLALLDAPDALLHAEMRALAQNLASDAGFVQRPCWRGRPAETGPWTRCRADGAVDTVWLRLAARLPDLLRVASGQRVLRRGALSLGHGAGIAWSEMGRGVLVHWAQLEPGAVDPALARVAAYRVLAPTEWNFHPDGALAHALRDRCWSTDDAVLAAAALDPCIEIAIEADAEVDHA
jgi:hypothetical protein